MERDRNVNPNRNTLVVQKLESGVQQESSAGFRFRIPSGRVRAGIARGGTRTSADCDGQMLANGAWRQAKKDDYATGIQAHIGLESKDR